MKLGLAAFAAASLIAGAAFAQEKPAGMPQDIADMLREIGPAIEVQRTGPAYTALHTPEPYEDVLLYRDVKYGPHERHVLDIFASPENVGGKPVLVFVHGGGFTGGTKHGEGSAFYDNISRWAANNGMVGVQITYRLAPEFQFPAGVEDLDRVVEWLKENAAIYGGDPEQIVLWGHSAGASHVADYVAAHAEEEEPELAAAVLMSGFYQLDADEPSVWASYYGEDSSSYGAMAALPGLVETDVPLLVVDAELDLPDANAQADLLVRALEEAGKPVHRVHLPNHTHISEAYAIGTADTSLSDPLKAFVAEAVSGE
jgi:acetyl esterase/lipase